jgi:hypothetical protein
MSLCWSNIVPTATARHMTCSRRHEAPQVDTQFSVAPEAVTFLVDPVMKAFRRYR